MYAPFCCIIALHWRWRFCVDLCLLNTWNGCRVDRTRTARTFVLLFVRLNLNEGFISVRCSHSFSLICDFAFNIHNNNGNKNFCWSPFVERMERVFCCPWTNRPYVCIAVCMCSNLELVLVFDAVRGRNITLIIYTHYHGDDGSALIFVCWMYAITNVVLTLN